MRDSQRIYEFNFDAMTIGDYLVIMQCASDPKNTSNTVKFIEMLPKFTNIDVLNLPLSELHNVIRQAVEQLMAYGASNQT